MDTFLLALIGAQCAAAIVMIVRRPARVYEYPWMMSCCFAGFVGLQMYGLYNHLYRVPPGAFESLVFMANLCLAGCWVGYFCRKPGAATGLLAVRLVEGRLYYGGVVLTLGGLGFTLSMRVYAGSEDSSRDQYGNFTGVLTILSFFAGMAFPGVAIVLRHALRTQSGWAYLMCGVSLIAPVEEFVLFGRREATVNTCLIVGGVLFFQRGVKPPRLAVIAAVVAAAVFIPVTGQYRALVASRGPDAVADFDLITAFRDAMDKGDAPEVTYACYCIANVDSTGEFAYGSAYWNNMIFRFVPAQIVTMEFKNALMITQIRSADPYPYASAYTVGTTITGLADAYQQFSYAGCLFFVGMGALFRYLWAAAQRGAALAQLLYLTSLTSAMRAVTHQTSDFLPALTFNVFFIGAVALVAWPYPQEQG